MKTSLILASIIGTTTAFTTQPHQFGYTTSTQSSTSLNGGASGYATSLEGKKQRVETLKTLLSNSEMIFSIPASGLTVGEVQKLRRSLPEGTTMTVVKNKIMSRAVEGTDFQEALANSKLVKGANMWFFIEEDIGGTVKAFDAFAKDCGKRETHMIQGGVIESTEYDAEGVKAVSKLPSKMELIARIAGGIKAVPTKLARSVKATPEKMARAIKLATAEGSD